MKVRSPSKHIFGIEVDPLSVVSNRHIKQVHDGSTSKVANHVHEVIKHRKRSLSGSGSYFDKNIIDNQRDKENIKNTKREKKDLNVLKPSIAQNQVLSKKKNHLALLEKESKKEIVGNQVDNLQPIEFSLKETFSLARKAYSQNTDMSAIALTELLESSRPLQWKTMDTYFKSYLDDSFQCLENCPTMMVLRGPPGTGKSAMIRSYIELKEEYFLPDNQAKMVWINGMTIVNGNGYNGSTKAFRNTSSVGDGLILLKKLAKEWLVDVPNKTLTFEGLTEALYTFIMNTDVRHVLVVDEFDILLRQHQSSLAVAIQLLGKWSIERVHLNKKNARLKENQLKKKKASTQSIPPKNGGLLLVGLTNALHFELPQADELDPSCLCMLDFHPYGVSELVAILKGRLQKMVTDNSILADFFTSSALECIARKTANLGDIRSTFSLASASLAFAEKDFFANKENHHVFSLSGHSSNHEGSKYSNEHNHITGIVNIKHVQQAIVSQKSGHQISAASGTSSNTIDMITSCPLQQQLILVALLGCICQKNPTTIRQHATSCICSFEQVYSQYHCIFIENPTLAATFPVILTRHELLDTFVLLEGRFPGSLVRLVHLSNSSNSCSTNLTSPKGTLPAVQLIMEGDVLKTALQSVSVLQQVITNLYSTTKYSKGSLS